MPATPSARSITSLKEVLLQHVRNREQHEPSDYWHPSKLGICDRRAVLSRAGVKGTDPDDATLLKFWIGEVIHEALQKVLTAELPDEVIGHEVSVRDEVAGVSGKIDSLMRAGTEGAPWEFKSVDSDSFRFSEFPKSYHLMQLFLYLVYGPFRTGRLAYIGKQDGRIEEYTVEWSPEVDAFIRGEIARLDKYLAAYKLNGALPPPLQIAKTKWQIAKCEYRGSGLCCGDSENDSGRAPSPGDDQALDEPSGLSGILPLGLFQLETPRPLRRSRKSRKTQVERLAQGLVEESHARQEEVAA